MNIYWLKKIRERFIVSYEAPKPLFPYGLYTILDTKREQVHHYSVRLHDGGGIYSTVTAYIVYGLMDKNASWLIHLERADKRRERGRYKRLLRELKK